MPHHRNRRFGLMAALLVVVSGCASDDAADTQATDGRQLFLSAGCGTCHVLADAGTTGTTGPNLDVLQPTAERVTLITTYGRGLMPSFADQLTEEQREAIGEYVASVTGAE